MIASGVTDAGAARPGKAAAVTHVITPLGTAAAPFAPPREGGPLTKAVSLEDAPLPLRCGPCGVPRRRKMLVICVDGCRGDALMMAAPDVMRPLLRTPGVSFTFHARCDDAPVSYPSWATTFTGVAEADHGVHDNAEHRPPKAPSVAHRLKAAGMGATTALYASGWFGLRNVFSRAGAEAPTFGWADGDEAHVDGVLDVVRPFGHDALEDPDWRRTPPGAWRGDAEATAAYVAAIRAGEASDLGVVYLWDVDRVGHRDGFGPQVDSYVEAVAVAFRDRVAPLLAAVAEREAAVASARAAGSSVDEEWLVVVTTDHGGSARKSTGRAVGRRFDALRGGDAYGQRHYEGVHGDAQLKAHAATFLLTKAPPRVDPGGEILDDDVRNSDVAATILHWLGADYADLRGTPRGVGLERAFAFDHAKGDWCDDKCCVVNRGRSRRPRGPYVPPPPPPGAMDVDAGDTVEVARRAEPRPALAADTFEPPAPAKKRDAPGEREAPPAAPASPKQLRTA